MNTITLGNLPIEAWLGIFIPLLIAFIQQRNWPSWARTLTGVLTCFVAAVVLHVGDFADFHSFLQSLTTLLTLSAVFYKAYWKPSGIAPAIDNMTQFSSHTDDGVSAPPVE